MASAEIKAGSSGVVPVLSALANAFPLWVLGACGLALYRPSLFTWFDGPRITWGLAAVMLGMGMTLDVSDFARVAKMPKAVVMGFIGQYLIMPMSGLIVVHLLSLPRDVAVGILLVACAPGGTASNVVTYLARADVALSVLMTMCSTAGAIVMTPLLTSLLAGQYVPVDGWGLFVSMLQVVLAPVALGVLLHRFLPRLTAAVLPAGPLLSVLCVALICASIVGSKAPEILGSGLSILLAVVLLHALGFSAGYAFAWVTGFEEIIRRTVSIEVGMQNSGLAAVLATRHFVAQPQAPVPCALSAVTHSVIGSLLAGLWRLRPARPSDTGAAATDAGPRADPTRAL
jgi:BASS family bile acid:Na+ symporter